MMKKSIALSLALLYIVTVLGFAINFHYCLNQVSSVKINEPVKKCSSVRVVKAMKCCKDKHVDVKVKDGHQSSSSEFIAKNFVASLPSVVYAKFPLSLHAAFTARSFNRGPPLHLGNQPSITLLTATSGSDYS